MTDITVIDLTTAPDTPKPCVIDLRYDETFDTIMNRLMRLQPMCTKLDAEIIIPLARLLKMAGCQISSGLWIAMKFAGIQQYTPDANLMAMACNVNAKGLVDQEAADLKMLEWDLAPYARQAGLIQ